MAWSKEGAWMVRFWVVVVGEVEKVVEVSERGSRRDFTRER